MAPTQSPLKAIRKQAAIQKKNTASALNHSAYNLLTKANEELIFGKRKRDDDEGDDAEKLVVREPVKKKAKRVTQKKPAKAKAKVVDKPAKPFVEVWRPAGGDKPFARKKKNPTAALAIARLSTWRLDGFVETLRNLIEQHGQIEEIRTEELVHGGESVTDVFVQFRSELVAESVKEKIDGELLDSRKLQVNFASN